MTISVGGTLRNLILASDRFHHLFPQKHLSKGGGIFITSIRSLQHFTGYNLTPSQRQNGRLVKIFQENF